MVTLSPGRIRMKFIRSFPEIWARTVWPFSARPETSRSEGLLSLRPVLQLRPAFDIEKPSILPLCARSRKERSALLYLVDWFSSLPEHRAVGARWSSFFLLGCSRLLRFPSHTTA